MKKIYFYGCMLGMALMPLITSCGDNENVSVPHQLTQEEIDEIARQDSILEAQKNKINADLILEYSVDITISETAYTGANVQVEMDKISELFGISTDDILAGIAGETGAPDIKGFAIEGTTHADNGTASNSNSTWGHWWNADGDVTAWGDNARVCAEFDYETGQFVVSQMPGTLVDGQTIKIIEGLKYLDNRVAVVITINAKGLQKVTADVVNTQVIDVDITPASDYSSVPVEFDLDKTLADLGVSSMDEVKFVGVKEDGSYAQEYTTTNGFWYDLNGFAASYSDDSRVFTAYGEEGTEYAENCIGLGQYPNKLVAGDALTVKYGILANNKIEMLELHINVKPYEDPETAPAGDPTSVEKDITVEKAYDNAFTAEEIDVKDILRDAFKMTTYQIHQARVSGDLKMYIQEVSSEDPEYTATAPGYWIDAEGASAKYADGIVFAELSTNETTLSLKCGNHPDNCSPNGTTVTAKIIFTCNGGQVTLNVTYNITAAAE